MSMHKVWLPTIKTGSGADVYSQILADALGKVNIESEISWFRHGYELCPWMLSDVTPPPGTTHIIANSWNAFAFKRQNLPLVVIEHHCVFDPLYSPYKTWAQRLYHALFIRKFSLASFRMASKIVAVSNFTAESLNRGLKIRDAKIIYNAIPIDTYAPSNHEARDSGKPLRILFVGNLVSRKGADLLLPIIQSLGAGFELRLVSGLRGGGVTFKHQQIRVLGRLSEEELVREYQHCDIFLFPTRFEGFGYTVLEAMACGLPVVVTDCSSLPELVLEDKGGYLCRLGDVAQFAKKINILAESSVLRKEMGEFNRTRVEEKFTLSRMVNEYKQLFEEVLDKKEVLKSS